MDHCIKVLFMAAEAEPYVKVGGLADVAGSLPLALRRIQANHPTDPSYDIRLVLPLHHSSRINPDQLHQVAEFSVHTLKGDIPARAYQVDLEGMPVYFINGDPISSTFSIYSMNLELDQQRYGFFSLAALEMLRHLDWQPDILHANDWHTSLALYAIKTGYAPQREGNPTRTVLTLHNLPFMGGDACKTISLFRLKPIVDESLPNWARTFPLPLGLWAADAIIPVSPTYASEIQTPEYGNGLEDFLCGRNESISGILNGLNVDSYNPEKDASLKVRFSTNTLELRQANKTALQTKLGLPVADHTPLLAMVGRIDLQKGQDIVFEVLRGYSEHEWQFVLLGTGDPHLENEALNLQSEFPSRVRAVLSYDGGLARLIYAGADIFLMPSRYEPCGLSQMIAMHYGCVPIVHATGGLIDTVEEGKTGFLFEKAAPVNLQKTLDQALRTYLDRGQWEDLQRNGMVKDFSWTKSAREYAVIYRSLTSLESVAPRMENPANSGA